MGSHNVKLVKIIHITNINSDKQEVMEKQIESRLSIWDQIEATIEESLKKTESLRQSNFKEAFEGRLV